MPFLKLLPIAVARMNLDPSAFWQLTFAEWSQLYESIIGKIEKPMNKKESDNLIAEYLSKFKGNNGNA